MPKPIRLTDEEIARKFEIQPSHPMWETVKRLAQRLDRIICVLPDLQCPHCDAEFQAAYVDVCRGHRLFCPECERTIWIESIDLPEGPDDDGSPGEIVITLTTQNTRGED